jgi:hypothetical protein
MGRFICALVTAMAISGTAVTGQAPVVRQRGTERQTPQSLAAARNLMRDISTEGCIRLWKPLPDDPTKMPVERQPGLAGIYLLTPLSSSALAAIDNPTYLLTPSGTINFSQHVGHRVAITGTAQAAPLPRTVQETAAPAMRPEEKPTTDGMPRLTVTTLKLVSEGCP